MSIDTTDNSGEEYIAPKIYIPNDKIDQVVQKAYELSVPQGMGFLHFQEGPLPADEVARITAVDPKWLRSPIHLDYVRGRAVKLTIHRDDSGRAYVVDNDGWFDHSYRTWVELREFIFSLSA